MLESRPVRDRQYPRQQPLYAAFPPGSEWLYARLFIRYADPEPQARLRFHGDPARLTSELLPLIASAFGPLVADGRLARWQIDTYTSAWRWKLGLCGVDLLLHGFAFTHARKRDWARQQRDAFAVEFGADEPVEATIRRDVRVERNGLYELLRAVA